MAILEIKVSLGEGVCVCVCNLSLTYRLSFLSLPLSVSHLYIGQCQVDNIKLSIFRYCQPTPFLASTSKGLYKRMRWNVERKIGTEAVREEEKNDNRTEVKQEMEGEQEAKGVGGTESNSTE